MGTTINWYDAVQAMDPCATCGQRGHHMSWHETPAETNARMAAEVRHEPSPKPHDWHTKTPTGPWHAYCSVCDRPITCRAAGKWVHR